MLTCRIGDPSKPCDTGGNMLGAPFIVCQMRTSSERAVINSFDTGSFKLFININKLAFIIDVASIRQI